MIFKMIIFRLTKFSQLRASWNQAALWTGISRELLTVRKKETFFLINLQTFGNRECQTDCWLNGQLHEK